MICGGSLFSVWGGPKSFTSRQTPYNRAACTKKKESKEDRTEKQAWKRKNIQPVYKTEFAAAGSKKSICRAGRVSSYDPWKTVAS